MKGLHQGQLERYRVVERIHGNNETFWCVQDMMGQIEGEASAYHVALYSEEIHGDGVGPTSAYIQACRVADDHNGVRRMKR